MLDSFDRQVTVMSQTNTLDTNDSPTDTLVALVIITVFWPHGGVAGSVPGHAPPAHQQIGHPGRHQAPVRDLEISPGARQNQNIVAI